MVKVKGKIFKAGNSYGIRLSKLWVDSKIVELGQEIEIELPVDIRDKDVVTEFLSQDNDFTGFSEFSVRHSLF